jgi:phosphoribosylanthranilate isomerase
MRDPENIRQVGELPIQFMGFIFYPPSPRFADSDALWLALKELPPRIRKTGVFVSELLETVLRLAEKYALDAIQLHGKETPEDCFRLKTALPDRKLIKAFPVSTADDLAATEAYATVCDYFLFDTKTSLRGGSGRQFDWQILESFQGKTPFFLSGGLSPNDADRINAWRHPSLCGIDLNSRFEIRPGIKNVELLRTFINTIEV